MIELVKSKCRTLGWLSLALIVAVALVAPNYRVSFAKAPEARLESLIIKPAALPSHPCKGQPWPHFDAGCLASIDAGPIARIIDVPAGSNRRIAAISGSNLDVLLRPTSLARY